MEKGSKITITITIKSRPLPLAPSLSLRLSPRAVIYPDSDDTTSLGDGIDETYDRVEYQYNRLGQTVWTKDQNEMVHEYAFDDVGRQTDDKVTTLGTNVDGTVRRISREYEVRGMVASVA
jgi:hypothetical protein